MPFVRPAMPASPSQSSRRPAACKPCRTRCGRSCPLMCRGRTRPGQRQPVLRPPGLRVSTQVEQRSLPRALGPEDLLRALTHHEGPAACGPIPGLALEHVWLDNEATLGLNQRQPVLCPPSHNAEFNTGVEQHGPRVLEKPGSSIVADRIRMIEGATGDPDGRSPRLLKPRRRASPSCA